MLTSKEVRSALFGAIKELQEKSGDPVPEITNDTRPVEDIEGFDSLRCLEVEVLMCEQLGVELNDIPFRRPGRAEGLRISEIVDGVLASLSGASGAER